MWSGLVQALSDNWLTHRATRTPHFLGSHCLVPIELRSRPLEQEVVCRRDMVVLVCLYIRQGLSAVYMEPLQLRQGGIVHRYLPGTDD
jgi:hypothetical protein